MIEKVHKAWYLVVFLAKIGNIFFSVFVEIGEAWIEFRTNWKDGDPKEK